MQNPPSSLPRIEFKKLKGFPMLGEELETEKFLHAANEIVIVIETFGKLFKPIIHDMNGNITKLSKSYIKDRRKFMYMRDLIVLNDDTEKIRVADALLWLKRGLQLICIFFENILQDTQRTENLRTHLKDAYEKTLKPYHGFVVQSTIKLIYNWVPTRSQLIGQGIPHDENLQVLSVYLPAMRNHLNEIDILLKKHNFDVDTKV